MQSELTEERGEMLVLFREVAEGLHQVDADDRHKILDSVLDWFSGGTGEVEGLQPTASLIAKLIREKQLAYAGICRKRRAAGVKSGASRRGDGLFGCVQTEANSKSVSKSKSESVSESNITHKCHPTLEDVCAYCKERGNHVDPEAWYAYYESNGWRVGRNPMKDWRAAVRTWERNGIESKQTAAKHSDNYCGASESQIKEFSDGFGK